MIAFSNFYESRIFRAEDVILFSCLLSVVILLIWLVYYLRNNPLKAHYPISKKYMFGEFMLLFLVFFSSATFFLTFRQGIYSQARSMTAHTDLVEEANAINLAFHFIPIDLDDFLSCRSCDSLKAREERREERLQIYEDSQKQGKSINYNYVDNEPLTYSDTLAPSYLNYCQMMILNLDEGHLINKEENSRRAVSWLKGGNKDSVRMALSRLQELLQKYEVFHRFDPIRQADSVFSSPGFMIRDWIYYNPNYDYEFVDTAGHGIINYNDLRYAIGQVEEVREGFWRYEMLIALLYYSLGAAIVLYSFRMIKARIWFAALIGTGLWAILLGLVFSLSDMEEEGVFSVFLFLFLAFLALAVWLIRGKENKFFSGLTFLWAMWSQLAVFPLIVAFVSETYKYEERVVDTVYGPTVEEVKTPLYTWINDNFENIFTFNLGLFLVLLFLIYIPLARRWQANPEQ
ncbi:MAG TPA: hypothetical protein DIW47_12015 [Bacteroidetes bacterium]|nr:hypothetical protein [Bacteroidota bacterium]